MRRREREARRHVIEALVRFVRQQQRFGVDLETEQIANGVGVFGAVQPMHAHAPGLGFLAAAGSSAVDNQVIMPLDASRSGRGRPAGGI